MPLQNFGLCLGNRYRSISRSSVKFDTHFPLLQDDNLYGLLGKPIIWQLEFSKNSSMAQEQHIVHGGVAAVWSYSTGFLEGHRKFVNNNNNNGFSQGFLHTGLLSSEVVKPIGKVGLYRVFVVQLNLYNWINRSNTILDINCRLQLLYPSRVRARTKPGSVVIPQKITSAKYQSTCQLCDSFNHNRDSNVNVPRSTDATTAVNKCHSHQRTRVREGQ